jgi:two-component system, cell cycle response regulator CtrA
MADAARLEALAAEIERLRDRIDELEALLGMSLLPPLEWRLTASQARVLGVIHARPYASKDAIMAALYRDGARDEAEIKIVDVMVCHIRRKLKPFGIEIITRWGEGFEMPAASKALVDAALQPAPQVAA